MEYDVRLEQLSSCPLTVVRRRASLQELAKVVPEACGTVRIALSGVRAVFHRPHPQKETDKGALRSMRRFLTEAGVRP